MPKPPNILRPTRLEISIPEDLRAWLELHLFSVSEQRVPHGAYSRLILQLLRDARERITGTVQMPFDSVEEVPRGTPLLTLIAGGAWNEAILRSQPEDGARLEVERNGTWQEVPAGGAIGLKGRALRVCSDYRGKVHGLLELRS